MDDVRRWSALGAEVFVGPGDPHALLAAAASVLGLGVVDLGHLCPRCGSAGHGRPFLVGRPDLFVSLARAGTWGAVALSRRPVGVDAEAAGRVVPGLAGVVGEPGASDAEALRAWVAKEAALKLAGSGLATDPSSLRLDRWGSADLGGRAVALAWPDAPGLLVAVAAWG